jgi:hypothetical protein
MSHKLSIAIAVIGTAVLLPLVPPASAQGLPPQSSAYTSPMPLPAAVTLQAKITAINPQTRAVTLTGANGNSVTITAGPLVNLAGLNVGDTVNAQYYRSTAMLLSLPGAPVPDNEVALAAARNVQTPGGDVLTLIRVSATVVGIDLATNSIDVVNPSGGAVLTVIVTDPARIAMLPHLRIGDTITAVVTQSLAVSITPAPKSWF